jgi:DnaK suppressor protein
MNENYMREDQNTLTQLKKLLLEQHEEIQATLQGINDASDTVTLDQSRVGRISRMDAMQQQAMAQAETQQLSQRLKLIARALKKFNSDDYGYCEACDEIISSERLLIKPESQYCINCQEKKEQA